LKNGGRYMIYITYLYFKYKINLKIVS